MQYTIRCEVPDISQMRGGQRQGLYALLRGLADQLEDHDSSISETGISDMRGRASISRGAPPSVVVIEVEDGKVIGIVGDGADVPAVHVLDFAEGSPPEGLVLVDRGHGQHKEGTLATLEFEVDSDRVQALISSPAVAPDAEEDCGMSPG